MNAEVITDFILTVIGWGGAAIVVIWLIGAAISGMFK